MDFNTTPNELMASLEKMRPDMGKVADYIKQYDPNLHDIITDKAKFPDKLVEKEGVTRQQPINRIAVAFQKSIVNKAVAFGFSLPVTYTWSNEAQAEMVLDILKRNKADNLTRSVVRDTYITTHGAEIWYTVESERAKFNSALPKRELRVLQLKASKGDVFYPIIVNGDMLAFVRELKKKDEEGKEYEEVEIYTAESKRVLTKQGGDWTETANERNLIGKIPVIYAQQDAPEWGDVQTMIERIEVLISGHAEVNDYHFAPKMKARGNITGFAEKGEKGAIFTMDPGADLDYITWNQGTDSLKLEYDNLRHMIYNFTQTPDVSMENMMRVMGGVSGVAARYFFMDAHLKVEMKREIWEDYLIRRVNIIKSFIEKEIDVKQAKAMQELEVYVTLNPFIIDEEKEATPEQNP